MAATVAIPALGTYRLGGAALGTASGGSSAGPGGGGGGTDNLLMLEANDRYQVVVLMRNGTSNIPAWCYWNPAPAPWGEALVAPNPADFPTFYALNSTGTYPTARWESGILNLGRNPEDECIVAGIDIDFSIRPNALDSYDGGDGSLGPQFTVQILAWGVAESQGASTFDGLTTSVFRSQTLQWAPTTPGDVSVDPWPHFRTTNLACSMAQPVRRAQIVVTDIFGVEFLDFRIQGAPVAGRS